ncbi:bifunctional phosphopantothenoylcysteine decarboxylase/phosphopantothenate--cysteine ligase CoaBC [Subdoligranulum sp. DSM 109015]|uniref:Coenzyme A biosynthesis bifunctional protein CoaBC n=1 Tax=Gemmiger gallinarum TaxID=2779354 RepID=A0ABR9R115_9FIRM|nr:bifunctional phosphopantothenoylcysteine decarboxylase/phosphopantothenate--cysteine ligase CoaBC [Gemmiger gallinarum]MBE5036828.1 bifunctional phosphopantothenoylcysteine decarboxylase/phosphopantothenate--cysteine ligase CoaBC [Gemmiger gallinarum]
MSDASLKGKTVVLGVTGGIAAYKIPNVAHALAKLGADVHVLMTKNATEFIAPLVFETLTNNRCIVDTFDRNFQYDVAHVSLANKADLMLIAPATANVIAKMAHGLADDMLTTVTLAATCPKLVAPAMNTHMLENPITQDNLKTLERYGFTVIPSGSGLLACGDTGSGRLPEESVLVDYVVRELVCPKDMAGMKVVVSAGATCEPMDPVRYITNHSTGKMGCAVARACMLRGADVTLLCARDAGLRVPFVRNVPFVTAKDLFEAVKENVMDADALVMAAAVADYRPAVVAEDKVKKADGALSLALERTDDILAWAGANKPENLYLCGFSMETRDLIENSTAKLHKKNLDLIVANNLKVPGAGFGVDTNVVTLISADGAESLPLQSKDAVAMRIADEIVKHRKAKQ